MARTKAKAAKNMAKKGATNGSRTSSARTANAQIRLQLQKRREDRLKRRTEEEKELKKVMKDIADIKTSMAHDENQEKLEELETTLQNLISKSEEIEKNLAAAESDLMEVDSEILEINNGDPMEGNDGEMEDREDNETENGDQQYDENGDMGQTEQSESAKPTVVDLPAENSNLPSTRDQNNDGLNQASISEMELSTQRQTSNENRMGSDEPVDSTELFVGQEMPSDQPQPVSEEMDHQPKDFDDLITMPTPAKAHTGFSLENGVVLLYAKCRQRSLNFYGARNSPMLIWSTVQASRKLANVTNLLGAPHSKAMDRDDEADVYRYKGKISAIKAIAWLPRHGGDTMLGLLKSVEELNPSNKVIKYIYPFSTVLVELEGTATEPGGKNQAVWIDRTKYKRLSSAAKDSSARTDRKFYEMACLQVRRFRDWAGKRLDEGWEGEAREERDQSPTPLRETPWPESGIVNQGPAAQNQSDQNQNPQNQNPQNQNPQNQNPQNQNPQNQNPQNQNPQSQNAQNLEPHSQSNPETPPQSLSGNTVVHEQRQENPPQLTYHKKKYLKEMLGMIDDFGSLGMQEKMEARSHALAQFHIYQQAMELQGAIEVTD